MDLVSFVFENAERWARQPIYVDLSDPSVTLDASDVKACTRKVIAGLRVRRAATVQTTVCVLSYNSVWYTPLYLGIVGAGARFVGGNPAYSHGELQHLFRIAEVNIVVTDPSLVDKVWSAAQDCGIARSNVLLFDSGRTAAAAAAARSDFDSWQSLLLHGEGEWIRFDDEQQAEDTAASLLMTSGTTGFPKAAVISHRAHIAQTCMIDDSANKTYPIRRLLSIPQFHAFTIPLAHFLPLRRGQTTYVMRRFELQAFASGVADFGVTETAIVPPMAHAMTTLSEAGRASLASLRHLWCAGAPLSKGAQARFVATLDPQAVFSQVWGMSEIGWITGFAYPERDVSGSVGRLLKGFEAEIRSPTGQTLEEGEHGEIWVRSPSLMKGYLNNVEATQTTIVDGWLRTGDIGTQRGGKWYVTDREKDLIKVRGWQVSPTELEACLTTHPAVSDAAVIGVQVSETTGELPKAYVVLRRPAANEQRPDETELQIELQAWVSSRLAKFKALAGGVVFVDVIPRNASGKTLRRVLLDMEKESGEK